MVAIAMLLQTVFHPGFCFPRLSTHYIVPVAEGSDSSRTNAVEEEKASSSAESL